MKLLQQLHPLMEDSKTESANDRSLLLRIINTAPKDSEALEDSDFWKLVRENVRTGNAILVTNNSDPKKPQAYIARL